MNSGKFDWTKNVVDSKVRKELLNHLLSIREKIVDNIYNQYIINELFYKPDKYSTIYVYEFTH